jgi:RHS repeat-associated protein
MTASATCANGEVSHKRSVTDTYEYDGFGNLLNPASSGTSNNYLYRGEQFDPDLGLYYLRARYYDPLTGRFMSRDPQSGFLSAPMTLHRYLYGAADPIDWRDPSGRELVEDALTISRTSVGAIQYANTIGCVANILLVASADELNVWTYAGIGGATYGCVSSFIWPGGETWLALKTTVDVGLCGLGLIQLANDFSQELRGQTVTNKAFTVDAVSGVLGCAVTNLGKVLEGGH